MRRKAKPSLLAAQIVLMTLLVAGCATSSTSTKFSQSEIRLIPAVAIEKVLSPGPMKEAVKVRAGNFSGAATVKVFEAPGYVIAESEQGTDIRLAIHEITEIERVRQFGKMASPSETKSDGALEAVGEALIYAPLIPVALVTRPFLHEMGLDEEKNSREREKLLLVYGGMTRDELKEALGDPVQQHLCNSNDSRNKFEVWRYKKELVISGGEYLFLDLNQGKVFFASFRPPSWASCSQIMKN